jgi:hypothetical protein
VTDRLEEHLVTTGVSDSVDETADFMVGVLGKSGADFHLRREEFLLGTKRVICANTRTTRLLRSHRLD